METLLEWAKPGVLRKADGLAVDANMVMWVLAVSEVGREGLMVGVSVLLVAEVMSDVECVTGPVRELEEVTSDVAVDLASVVGNVATKADNGVVTAVAVVAGGMEVEGRRALVSCVSTRLVI